MTKLTLDDISDLRAYERERADSAPTSSPSRSAGGCTSGPVVTLLFENRDTIRFQIQEMARVEKLISDEAIETELAIYNPLIPDPGTLSATLFIELTSEDELREWLPKLVGHRDPGRAAAGRRPRRRRGALRGRPRPRPQLTRDEITASVHYVHWQLTADRDRGLRPGSGAAGRHPSELPARHRAEPTRPGPSSWPTCGAELAAGPGRRRPARAGPPPAAGHQGFHLDSRGSAPTILACPERPLAQELSSPK